MSNTGIRSEKRKTKGMTLLNLSSEQRNQRRRFLGWLGMGVFGAFALGMMPARFLSRRFVKRRSTANKIKAIPNELAVKRSKRV